ncbi:MAG: DUF1576 domain-containing protein [Spirochaetales bacterium]|nr:DUF1576 domain-containing protein [Spirochaetales bacterium]
MLLKDMKDKDIILFALTVLLTTFFISPFLHSGLRTALEGLWHIQTHPARLINDYVAIAGVGGAMLNAALVGLVGLTLIKLAGIQHSGPTYAAIFTMVGFGLFGKTPLNILPIVLGVFIAAKVAGKTFKDYLIIALFGTALGPLVSTIAWEVAINPAAAIALGIAGGVGIGFLLPSAAISMLHLHQGYNLYNMGLTCGFLGLFAAALIKGLGHEFATAYEWYTGSSLLLTLLIPCLSLFLIVVGIAKGKKECWPDFKELLTLPGRLPSDFTDYPSLPAALINSGLLGLLGSAYVYFVGAPFNGPVIGGIMTVMGFGAFGTHIKNAWPILAGVVAATLLTGNSLSAAGPILAFFFSTTLAPLAGEFGIPVGITAGAVHLLMVMQTGAWFGGMNLYNNGFAGGLTAALLISVIQWHKTNKEEF